MFVHLLGYGIIQLTDTIDASRQQALAANGTMSENESCELSRSSGYFEIKNYISEPRKARSNSFYLCFSHYYTSSHTLLIGLSLPLVTLFHCVPRY